MDGNEAAASVAYRLNEICCIYPITPSSTMAELADQWSSERKPNVWGTVPTVVEMQSEGGAAGALHGSLQAGALATTFTASQGLLLMLPNMYKIAGELTPAVFHVAARSLAAQGLSIFGDHSDVMAARGTGFAMLASASVQEAHDMAVVAQAATLRSRVPFIHFFDGFRTSHELNTIESLTDDDLRALVSEELVHAHRGRALSPDRPFIRGTAQNPDTYFQSRETVNPYYARTPEIVQEAMDELAARVGRSYQLVSYHGHPEAERVLVLIGSGAVTARRTVERLVSEGERVGAVEIRLVRPFPASQILAALPPTVRRVAVLDRTKEPGSEAEPLFLDVVAALGEAHTSGLRELPLVVGGRYGLSSKEFTPAMVAGVLGELGGDRPRRRFTVGIDDDVGRTSIAIGPPLDIEPPGTVRAVFFGLGSDGTVGANKNTIKILGDAGLCAQGYFVYDSKKSGSQTVSHLRFGEEPIEAPYLVSGRELRRLPPVRSPQHDRRAGPGRGRRDAAPRLPRPSGRGLGHPAAHGAEAGPREGDRRLRDRRVSRRPRGGPARADEHGAPDLLLRPLGRAAARRCDRPHQGGDRAHLRAPRSRGRRAKQRGRRQRARGAPSREIPGELTSAHDLRSPVPDSAPEFVRSVTGMMLAGRGDELPVSALPVDGTYPSGTAAYEKRNISDLVAVWDPDTCIQCGSCSFVCPHSVIRSRFYEPAQLDGAPDGFPSAPLEARGLPDALFTLQVYVEDCTGCALCVEACPVHNPLEPARKAINLEPREPIVEAERERIGFFETLPVNDRSRVDYASVRGAQFLQPLFEFSGACAGCGETPYLKLLSQLFGERLMVANATGCSSIYGGNLPTTPWTQNGDGRGPAWSNSLFEDNAEFGLGFRLTADAHVRLARERLEGLRGSLDGDGLVDEILDAPQVTETELRTQRTRVEELKRRLDGASGPAADDLRSVVDHLVRRSVWIVGGDGWAYDIGSGGLDHVLASGVDVNVLVLDTEVYSNTGGQMSKATPLGAVAKFATAGKHVPKKDLALQAIAYGSVYVARVAMGADQRQTLLALREAEAFDGPSLVIAYSHCIAHGIDMQKGLDQQHRAVSSGYWPLLRYDPVVRDRGGNPFLLDSPRPRMPLTEYTKSELRFRSLARTNPAEAERLAAGGTGRHQPALAGVRGDGHARRRSASRRT